MRRKRSYLLMPLLLAVAVTCGSPPSGDAPPSQAAAPAPAPESAPEPSPEPSPQDVFWSHLTALCGQAFGGTMVSDDSRDEDFAGVAMTMHVRRCTDQRLEIPFHVGEDRSRTWVLTRTDGGLKLQHDHRHEDGTPDTLTLYGGDTQEPGSATAQSFPADAYSKELFEGNELADATSNVWSLEIEPGKGFSYLLNRPGRHFRADFDLINPVPEPPAPWGG